MHARSQGDTQEEEVLLNLGGVFAAVVAIVPTSRGADFRRALVVCRQAEGAVVAAREMVARDSDAGVRDAKCHVRRSRLQAGLTGLIGRGVLAVRGVGLWAGIDIDPRLATGRRVCELLMQRGVLAKDTHGSTIRLAPPLVITADELDHAIDQLDAVLQDLRA